MFEREESGREPLRRSEQLSLRLLQSTGCPVATYNVRSACPHDTAAFTQGLALVGDRLFESTGWKGRSSIREVEPTTGKVLKRAQLPRHLFGEGLVHWKGQLVSLTWRDRVGFRWDADTLQVLEQFRYPREGWGIATDGERLIVSDGTPTLRYLDPVTLQETHRLRVFASGRPLPYLNDLQWVGDEIWANIWGTDLIARIYPPQGRVIGWINLIGLSRSAGRSDPDEVLNGLTFDPISGSLLVTGKHWPALFELELIGGELPLEVYGQPRVMFSFGDRCQEPKP